MGKEKTTPAQQQYLDLKKKYADCILLFRMGDFYEMFYDDAKLAHDILHITLTARDKKSENPIPMAGIPYHALERYLPKLIEAGHKVAIAEQLSDAVPGKVVERDVVQVITPGTYFEHTEHRTYVGAVAYTGKSETSYHAAWGDFSVGKYRTQSFSSLDAVCKRFASLGIKELVVVGDFPELQEVKRYAQEVLHVGYSLVSVPHDIETYLFSVLKTSSLDGYGQSLTGGRELAMAGFFSYIESVQMKHVEGVTSISLSGSVGDVHLDQITLRNLEVFQSAYEGSSKHSLFHVINCCRTSMGSRMLAEWLTHPTSHYAVLQHRLALIQRYVEDEACAADIRTLSSAIPDLPRLINKLIYGRSHPEQYIDLRTVFSEIFCTDQGGVLLSQIEQHCGDGAGATIETVRTLAEYLQRTFKEEVDEMKEVYIAPGCDSEIDDLVRIAYTSDQDILSYQQELLGKTGVSSLKIKYISNQGYMVEVSKKDTKKFESSFQQGENKYDFLRRQTLKSAERYVSSYLADLQQRVIEAKEQLLHKQQIIINQTRGIILSSYEELGAFFEYVAYMDVASSFAEFVKTNRWIRPELHEGYDLTIEAGRHPVVEKYLPSREEFIPNDVIFDSQQKFLILTGPNMGGKSTFLRQNALIVLLAHAGLWVPAECARIPLVDGIFARVGSGDALAKNQSTFMTEMLEMANILHNATANSFVILDELGRGTSTYDGMSLAKAIVQYMHSSIGCKTIFATHYHELLSLEKELAGCVNISVSVYETDSAVVFLKKIISGGADKSYGLDVAKLAGIPEPIVASAEKILTQLEDKKKHLPRQDGLAFNMPYQSDNDKVRQRLSDMDIASMTPIQAIAELDALKRLAQE